MAGKNSVLGLKLSSSPYLRSAGLSAKMSLQNLLDYTTDDKKFSDKS